jgi:signal transduction histidine kinase
VHDPNLIPLFVFGTLLVTAFAVAVIISLIIQKQRQVRARLERQRLEFHYTRMLLNTKIEVQESTLTMLSQELHDNVNQVLTAGMMQLSSADSYIKDETGKNIIETAKKTVKSAISDIRLLSHSLNTGMVEHRDTAEAIQDELTRIEAFSEISCTLLSEEEHDLPPEQRLLVFRIVQEALQNILKHARASHITVRISSTPQQYSLAIADDGTGFDLQDERIANSMGMNNMQARAALMKGTLNIASSPGKGTTLALTIPIAPENGQDTHSAR